MRRLTKFLLLSAMLIACASIGFWRAQEGRRDITGSNLTANPPKAFVTRYAGVTLRVNDDSFVLKNLKLERMTGSTILKGKFINMTDRYLDEATFEIKAYDRDGKLLRGVEPKTIFTAHQLKAKAATPLNSGYGVWLQGIPLEAIAKIEISETSDEMASSSVIRMIPLASHALGWNEYSEIEE